MESNNDATFAHDKKINQSILFNISDLIGVHLYSEATLMHKRML